eukprot:10539660-Alexandrium_andersonii.AAC.1
MPPRSPARGARGTRSRKRQHVPRWRPQRRASKCARRSSEWRVPGAGRRSRTRPPCKHPAA